MTPIQPEQVAGSPFGLGNLIPDEVTALQVGIAILTAYFGKEPSLDSLHLSATASMPVPQQNRKRYHPGSSGFGGSVGRTSDVTAAASATAANTDTMTRTAANTSVVDAPMDA